MLLVSEREQLPVREARDGDPGAWNVLFKRYQLPLYVYVFELVHHEQTALDIVQETFINAARYISNLRDDDKFGSWLFGIAHQKCISHWRKKRLETVPVEEEGEYPYPETGPDELLIRKEQEEAIMKAVSQLSLPHRSVLLLHFVEDFSLEEIAGITETQIGTVKSRLHYAKAALRKALEKDPT